MMDNARQIICLIVMLLLLLLLLLPGATAACEALFKLLYSVKDRRIQL
jgi:hypothetical protein